MRPASRLRASALLAAGALSLHELRYLLVSGPTSPPSARHDYLPIVLSAAAALVALALGEIVLRLGCRGPGGAVAERVGIWRLSLLATALLLVLFVGQESVESALGDGGPSGLTVLSSAGGWIAVPLGLLLGTGVALAGCAGREPLVPVRVRSAACAWPRDGVGGVVAVGLRLARSVGLARNLAGRGPPLASLS